MKLVMLRHLRTDFNVRGILQGRRDIPILPIQTEDRNQISVNLLKIKSEKGKGYDHVLSSGLIRTRMTANAYGYEPKTENLLDELDFGYYEGRPKQVLIKEQPLWTEHPDRLVLGEPLSGLEKRVKAFCLKYLSCDQILIFGHGAWIRALVSVVRSGSIKAMNKINILNNEIVVLNIPQGGF